MKRITTTLGTLTLLFAGACALGDDYGVFDCEEGKCDDIFESYEEYGEAQKVNLVTCTFRGRGWLSDGLTCDPHFAQMKAARVESVLVAVRFWEPDAFGDLIEMGREELLMTQASGQDWAFGVPNTATRVEITTSYSLPVLNRMPEFVGRLVWAGGEGFAGALEDVDKLTFRSRAAVDHIDLYRPPSLPNIENVYYRYRDGDEERRLLGRYYTGDELSPLGKGANSYWKWSGGEPPVLDPSRLGIDPFPEKGLAAPVFFEDGEDYARVGISMDRRAFGYQQAGLPGVSYVEVPRSGNRRYVFWFDESVQFRSISDFLRHSRENP